MTETRFVAGLSAIIAIALSGAAVAATSQADQAFVKQAIQADLSEVSAGQLAQTNGQSPEVKNFGKMLETEHGQDLIKARQVATQLGVNPPANVNDDQQALFDKLTGLKGAEFDKEFTQAMIEDHKKDIVKFQTQAKQTGPAADYAKQTLPALQKHLQTAQSISTPKTP